MKRTSRAPSVLSKSVHHQLKMYALAAGAAGVGALALSQAAEAKIVYTAAHLVLHRGDDPGLTKLDLNHDGVIDFTFSNFWVSGTRGTQPSGRLSVLPAQAENGIRVNISSDYFAAALQAGVSVGKNGELFAPARADMDFGNRNAGGCAGPWKNAKDRYLGMKFIIKGKLHFGWARLNVSCNPHNSQTTAVVTGYAYETIPGNPFAQARPRDRMMANQLHHSPCPLPNPPRWAYSRWDHPDSPYGDGRNGRRVRSKGTCL